MNNKQFEKSLNIFFSVSALLVLMGAFFKLQHHPIGNLLLWIGVAGGFIISRIEVNRLKKLIKKMGDGDMKG